MKYAFGLAVDLIDVVLIVILTVHLFRQIKLSWTELHRLSPLTSLMKSKIIVKKCHLAIYDLKTGYSIT